MAVARALACEDILVDVFENLAPGSKLPRASQLLVAARKKRQKTLARGACVCRAFSGPALQVLWRVIDDVKHLFRILPSFANASSNTILTGRVTKQDWARFQQYALRIEELVVDDSVNFNSPIWTIVAHWNGARRPLLPRLRRLELPVDEKAAHTTILVPPALDHLGLRMCKGYKTCWSFMKETLQPKLKSLRSLSVCQETTLWGRYLPDVGLIPRPWNLPQLQILQLHGISSLTPSLLRTLSSIPCLRDLKINYGVEENTVYEDGVRYPFLSLETLALSSDLSSLAKILSMVSFAELRSVTIVARSRCHDLDSDISTHLVPVLSTLPPGLRYLHVALACKGCNVGHSLTPDALTGPLHSQKELEDVSFRLRGFLGRIDMDEMLLTATESWPDLTSYELAFSFNDDDVQQYPRSPEAWHNRDGSLPRIATVIKLAECRPRLRQLHLPGIDLRVDLPSLTFIPALNHGLRSLDLSFLQKLQPLFELALILDKLFPNLDLMGADDFAVVPYHPSSDPNLTIQMLRVMLLALQTGRRHTHGLEV
ncbi:hypothetical protein OH77DRAFT_1010339 [Trametes cingulata]|nr:hypothetical protein OH77DRAFT_1010339 [Trametes cingulata]